jgi:hypothetical protein
MSTPPEVLRYPVAPPPTTPRPFGLLSVATDGEGSPAAGPAPWERGVDYYSPNCNNTTGSLEGFCPVPDETEKELTPFDPVRVEGAPFTVTSGTICLAPNFDAEGEARAQLARGEEYRVEDVFFNAQLARPDVEDLGVATDVSYAVGALEAYAAEHYGAQPVLHVPTVILPSMFRDNLVVRDGNRIVTGWGTPVVVGAGYPQSVPATLLITGQVTLWRSEVFVNSDFNVRKNERLAIAERTYVVTADCLAARIEIPGCPDDGGEEEA